MLTGRRLPEPGRLFAACSATSEIASFSCSEYQLNRIWAERARGRVQLWGLPDGKHTGAIDEAPEEYERRVIGFFDRRLLGSS